MQTDPSPPRLPGVTLMTTSGQQPHHRVDYWRELVCRRFAEVQIASRLGTDFSGRMETHQYASLRLATVAAKAQSVARVAHHAQTENEDCYFAVLLLAGSEFLAQDGREARLGAGDLAVYDATRPHKLIMPEDFTKLIVQIPRAALSSRVGGLERTMARRIDGAQGPGAVAAAFFRSLAGHSTQFDAAQRERLAEQALDMLAFALSPQPSTLPPARSRAITLLRVKQHIERHLGDPALSGEVIADAVGLSSRYVNQLFEEEDISLMRYVLKRRLEQCRDEFERGAGHAQRLYDVALRWGFNDPSHFSRAFRKHFGAGPREFCGLTRGAQSES
ncbi:helix-turn-helix domain-containing protein [Janthinobacterium sp. PC23-8]|uniref:AraC-like ligand-binding domain-containing protein n=1 Tax=Janthinobacterium sp. PC23-8 TaxID=2012679 RepID=UPI000B977F35|nr:helix-turn-helix domain-containing protein [Janthinobacterium sp. PC23-8]OYO30843.1 hypothetical protein CD932_06670 [Janthinobacterium sp. PC23-8]